jgi:hypothetical protein
MRTTLIIGGGLVLLGVCILIARWLGGADAIRIAIGLFIPLWLILAAVNMWFGVYRVGYSFTEELPVFVIIFSVPALAAVWLWWRHV